MHALDIDLRPSKQFASLIIAAGLGSLATVAFSALTLPNKILLGLLVILYTSLIGYKEFSQRPITRIIADNDGWRMGNGSPLNPVNILGESTVTRWVCVIRYKTKNRFFKKTCLVFRDSVKQDEFRQLVVALRYVK